MECNRLVIEEKAPNDLLAECFGLKALAKVMSIRVLNMWSMLMHYDDHQVVPEGRRVSSSFLLSQVRRGYINSRLSRFFV